MNHSQENILITGGAGFIGSHVSDKLLAEGHRVIVLDDLSTGKRSNLQQHDGNSRFRFIEGDVADDVAALTEPATSELGRVTRVVHLAAQTSVVKSIEQPLRDARVNYLGTLQVLEAARHWKSESVVLASSAAVYGDVETVPISEAAAHRPMSPYGVHKLNSEFAAQCYSLTHNLTTTCLRFFNVYGPRQDPSSPYSGVISIFLDRATRNQDLTVFGTGKQTRDFVYVEDVAEAVLRALFHRSAGFCVANIGTGKSSTIEELAALTIESCGSASQVNYADSRPGDIEHSLADNALAVAAFDVRFETTLRDGLGPTSRWYSDSNRDPE